MTSLAQLDDGTSSLAVYTLSKAGTPARAIIYNSNYYTSGTRALSAVTLTGLSSSQVTVQRLTAPYATSRQDQGASPTFAGQSFTNGTCVKQGTARVETVNVNGGSATFSVGDSEALLVSF
jgi:hypothetical protein